MQWYFDAFRQYATFKGRSTRQAFFMFWLFNILVQIVLGIADGMGMVMNEALGWGNVFLEMNVLTSIYSIAVLLPTLSITVRRLHDAGWSGKWVGYQFLIIAICMLLVLGLSSAGAGGAMLFQVLMVVMGAASLVCMLVVLVVIFFRSESTSNRYGPHPDRITDRGDAAVAI